MKHKKYPKYKIEIDFSVNRLKINSWSSKIYERKHWYDGYYSVSDIYSSGPSKEVVIQKANVHLQRLICGTFPQDSHHSITINKEVFNCEG